MTKLETAVDTFHKGFSCSQAVAVAYGPDFGLAPETALKVASAFGGGMGGRGETCGAVSGALLILGMQYNSQDAQAKEKIYQLTRTFMDKFISYNKSVICKELLGCDISTETGKNYVKANNLRVSLCTKYVEDAVKILDELLQSKS